MENTYPSPNNASVNAFFFRVETEGVKPNWPSIFVFLLMGLAVGYVKVSGGAEYTSGSTSIAGYNVHHFDGLPSLKLTYVLGSKLPLFPYNRGWSSTQ